MTRFLLIRHAMTNSVGKNISGRLEGVLLNDEGTLQAQHLAERLAGLPIHAVYCSPLERAQATALPLARLNNLEPAVNAHFLELDFGDWTDLAIKSIKEQPHFSRFNSFRSCVRIPGGELMLEAQLRIIHGLEKLKAEHPNETIAVVSHGDLIRAAIAYYAGIHLDLFQRLEISPASVSIVEIFDETARISLVNHTGSVKF